MELLQLLILSLFRGTFFCLVALCCLLKFNFSYFCFPGHVQVVRAMYNYTAQQVS